MSAGQVGLIIGEYTYLELSDNLLVEVLWTGVCSQGNKVAAIDVLFPHASFSFGDSCNSFPFQPSSFPLLFGLAALIWGVCLGTSSRQPEDPS